MAPNKIFDDTIFLYLAAFELRFSRGAKESWQAVLRREINNSQSEFLPLHIRQAISDAKHIEAQTPHLRHFLESKVDKLHHCIELPEHEPAEALYGFVLRYIEHVPEFIDALSAK